MLKPVDDKWIYIDNVYVYTAKKEGLIRGICVKSYEKTIVLYKKEWVMLLNYNVQFFYSPCLINEEKFVKEFLPLGGNAENLKEVYKYIIRRLITTNGV